MSVITLETETPADDGSGVVHSSVVRVRTGGSSYGCHNVFSKHVSINTATDAFFLSSSFQMLQQILVE